MISIPTVLVLGAGASNPYGLPLGQELTHNVCNELLNPRSAQIKVLGEIGFEPSHVNRFVNDLRYSGYASVDAFLETRPDYLQIGKAAIASSLIPRENPDSLFPPKARFGNWYQHLISYLSIDTDEFHKNSLSIVTFNYDRSLEHYLRSVIQTRRQCSGREALGILESLKIVHVHGSLGSLNPDSERFRDYSKELNGKSLKTAADGIIIVSEAKDDTDEFNAARDVLAKAERIYFLGLGYAKQNVVRLGFDGKQRSGVQGYGTVQNLSPRQTAEVRKLFYPEFKLVSHDCLNLFVYEAPLDS